MTKDLNFPRVSARALADIELNGKALKADYELTDKYQSFSAELLRLSLLGITGYGFLISEVVMNSDTSSSKLLPVLTPYD